MEQLKELDISVIEQFPKIDESKLDELLQKEIIKSGRKIIVLDDDPTDRKSVV